MCRTGPKTPARPTCRWVGPDRRRSRAEWRGGPYGSTITSVSVQKAIDLTGSGETIQDAVSEALDRARETVEGITRFEVKDITGIVEGPGEEYQVQIRVWFTVLERMHG